MNYLSLYFANILLFCRNTYAYSFYALVTHLTLLYFWHHISNNNYITKNLKPVEWADRILARVNQRTHNAMRTSSLPARSTFRTWMLNLWSKIIVFSWNNLPITLTSIRFDQQTFNLHHQRFLVHLLRAKLPRSSIDHIFVHRYNTLSRPLCCQPRGPTHVIVYLQYSSGFIHPKLTGHLPVPQE